jgi:hypothetical protein
MAAQLNGNKITASLGASRSLSVRADLKNAKEACEFVTQIIGAIESVFGIDIVFGGDNEAVDDNAEDATTGGSLN